MSRRVHCKWLPGDRVKLKVGGRGEDLRARQGDWYIVQSPARRARGGGEEIEMLGANDTQSNGFIGDPGWFEKESTPDP